MHGQHGRATANATGMLAGRTAGVLWTKQGPNKQRGQPVVQSQASAVEFPGGESMAGMQSRAVSAIRRRTWKTD